MHQAGTGRWLGVPVTVLDAALQGAVYKAVHGSSAGSTPGSRRPDRDRFGVAEVHWAVCAACMQYSDAVLAAWLAGGTSPAMPGSMRGMVQSAR